MRSLVKILVLVCIAVLTAYLIYLTVTRFGPLAAGGNASPKTAVPQSVAGAVGPANSTQPTAAPPQVPKPSTATDNTIELSAETGKAAVVAVTPPAQPAPSSTLDNRSTSRSGWVEFALGALLIVAVMIALILVLQYKQWRMQQLLKSPHIITPENLNQLIHSLNKALHDLATQFGELRGGVHQQRDEAKAAAAELTRTFLTLQGALDTRDQQLKKAEQGWEQAVFQRFVRRFARIDEMLNEPEKISADQLLEQTRMLLRDALEECGVEPFSPSLGADYRREIGVSDNPICVETGDAARAYQIAEVITPGYRMANVAGSQAIVIPAKVKVFVSKEVVHG